MNDNASITLIIDQKASSPSWVVVLAYDDAVEVAKLPEVGDEIDLHGLGRTKIDSIDPLEDGDSERDKRVIVTPWTGTDDELEEHIKRLSAQGWFEDDRAPARQEVG